MDRDDCAYVCFGPNFNRNQMLCSQELPKAEALLQAADDSADNDDDEKAINSLRAGSKKSQIGGDQMSDSDTSYSDNDESADLNRGGNGVNVKIPLELNLSELAHAIMQNNQK